MSVTIAPDSRFAAKVFPSANHGERRMADGAPGRRPDMLILHYTGMPDAGEALQWLCNPVSQVSSHYFVFENGHILQLVPEGRRAWHAGASHWAGESDINSCSIGIEIANPGHPGGLPDFPQEQIAATLNLCRDICERWGIPPGTRARPFRHRARPQDRPRREIPLAASRRGRRRALERARADPRRPLLRARRERPAGRGPAGDVRDAGLSASVDGVFDETLEAVVAAFQRHWRQDKVDGVADASTITTLRDLLAATRMARTA